MCHTGQRRRIKGGEAGGADGVEEETSARRAGLALHRREQKEERKSLRHSSFLSTNLSVSAFSSFPFSHRIWTHSVFFSLFNTTAGFLTLPFFLLPVQALYVLQSLHPFLSFFSWFCISPRHLLSTFRLFVCVLTIFSQGKSLA